MTRPFVAVMMGSDSDFPVMESSLEVLKKFEIAYEVRVTSAHRTPVATHECVGKVGTRSRHSGVERGKNGPCQAAG